MACFGQQNEGEVAVTLQRAGVQGEVECGGQFGNLPRVLSLEFDSWVCI